MSREWKGIHFQKKLRHDIQYEERRENINQKLLENMEFIG